MTGINVIGYYQTILYDALGFSGHRITLVAGIYNCLGPLANLIFIVFLLDRVGRRRPMIFGTIGISIALICEAALDSQNGGGTRNGYSIAGVVFIFCVSIIFSMSFGPCSWWVSLFELQGISVTESRVYMAEVMPMQIRGKGNAFATGVGNWAVCTLWSQISPIALGAIRWKYYFVFIAWSKSAS